MRNTLIHLDAVRARLASLPIRSLVRTAIRTASRTALSPSMWWTDPNARAALSALLASAAYYVGALVGFSVRFQSSPISPIWPPNAILLVALLLVPMRTWWVCLLAVCGAHMLVELPNGVPLATAYGLYLTNSAEAVIGALGVRLFISGPPWLGSLRRVTIYLVCAVVVAPVITSFADALVVMWTRWGDTHDYWLLWRTRCVSNSMAQLTIGPALLLGLTMARVWIREATRWRSAEAALLAAGLLVVGVTVFDGRIAWEPANPALLYAMLPFLLWAAIRFGVGGMSVSLLCITVLATWGAIRGRGPFSIFSPADDVISLQLFLIGISAPMLFLAALIREREETKSALRESEDRYRDLVESQTEMICRYLPDTTLTFVNQAFCRSYGRPREELVGTKFLHLMNEPAREHHLQYISALQAHLHPSVDEHEVMLPDGSIGWQQWVDHPICDAHGHVVEIQSVGRDITERRWVELALRESEARFRAAFESAATGMMLMDSGGHSLRVNRPLVEMLGYTEEELRSRAFADVMHPDDLDSNLGLFRHALAGEIESYHLEKRFIHKQGYVVWGLVSAGVVRDAMGQLLYIVGQVQDITTRKQAEEALRESEERYRVVASNFPHGAVLLFDEDLRHLFADGQGLPELGLSKASVEGKTIWEAFPDDLAVALAPRYEAALSGEHAAFDLVYAGHAYQMQILPIHYAGTMAGMAVMQDVTEQRRARDELERERTQAAYFSALSQEFRTLLDHSPDAITRFDRSLRLLYVNPRGETALSIPESDRFGKTYAELGFPESVYRPWEHALREVIATGEPRAFDSEVTARDGQVRALHVRYIPEFAPDGSIESILGITSDITELRQAKALLAEQASQLEAIFEAQMDAIAVYDLQGCFVRANTALRQLFGLATDTEYTARPLAERAERLLHFDEQGQLLSVDQWPLWRVLRGEIFAGGSAMETRVRTLDGREVWTSITGAPIRARYGQVTGAVLVTRDVTARRQLERRLAEQERQFRTLVEHSPDIIARFDRDVRYLYVNPAIGTVSPLPPQAFIGKSNAELGLPEPAYGPAHRAIAQVFATGQGCMLEMPTTESAAESITPSPTARTFLARFVPEFGGGDEGGAVTSVLTITTEITERKRAEVALHEAKLTAERAHQEEERRRQEAERREAIAASLRDALRILNSKRSLQEVLNVIAEQAGRLLGSAATAIYGTDEGTTSPSVGGRAMSQLRATEQVPAAPNRLEALEKPTTAEMVERLTLQAAAGLPLGSLSDQTHLLHYPSRLTFAHAAVRRALAARSPVAVLNGCGLPALSDFADGAVSRADRAAMETALPMQFETLPSPYQALLVVPIAVHEEVYGCLLLFYTMRWQFASEDVALATAYANQIALAIANARLQTHIAQAATEAERARLARDLHDTVTQELYSASLIAEALPQLWDQHRAEAERALGQLHEITQSGLATLRLLLLELRPAGLEEMTLPALVQLLLEAMRTRAGVPLSLDTSGTDDDWLSLPQEVKQTCYRMAQEAVTNAVKYAAASQIVVRLWHEQRGALRMEIEDDGVGFDPRTSAPGHFGLAMMRERAQAVGATVHVESQAGHGTRVVVRWRPHWVASAVAVQQEGEAHE